MLVTPGALTITSKSVTVGGIKIVVTPAMLATGAGCKGGKLPNSDGER